MSETRRRTELIPVRMTPDEAALLDKVVQAAQARGRGTILREAFVLLVDEAADAIHSRRWAEDLREILLQGRQASRAPHGGPYPASPPANAPGHAQDRPGGFSPAARRREARKQ